MPDRAFSFADNVTGIGDEERELICAYVKDVEIGGTATHCLCPWSKVDGRMKMIQGVHMDCPVHTKEGLILGFLKMTNVIEHLLYDESEQLLALGTTADTALRNALASPDAIAGHDPACGVEYPCACWWAVD